MVKPFQPPFGINHGLISFSRPQPVLQFILLGMGIYSPLYRPLFLLCITDSFSYKPSTRIDACTRFLRLSRISVDSIIDLSYWNSCRLAGVAPVTFISRTLWITRAATMNEHYEIIY